MLLVGNVLSPYFHVRRDSASKYEVARAVINADIYSFSAARTYDLVASISTLSHVGWDEQPWELGKPVRAIRNLMSWLAEGGKIVVTIPVAENPHPDRLVHDGTLAFYELRGFKMVSTSNEREEVDVLEPWHVEYVRPFASANAVVVDVMHRQ